MFHLNEKECDAIDALLSLSSSNPMMSFAASSTMKFRNTKKHQLPVKLRSKNSGYETLFESHSGKSPKQSTPNEEKTKLINPTTVVSRAVTISQEPNPKKKRKKENEYLQVGCNSESEVDQPIQFKASLAPQIANNQVPTIPELKNLDLRSVQKVVLPYNENKLYPCLFSLDED